MNFQNPKGNNNNLFISYKSNNLSISKSKHYIYLKSPDRKNENKINLAFHLFLKRTIDLILSSTLIILILSWLIPIIAILIKLESKGPIFFIQKRTGKGKNTFKCYKFRTMYVNSNSNRIQTQINDDRVTNLGKYMRLLFIDELPQLINVFLGNMSIIGPRPHMLRHSIEFSRIINNYHERHNVKPGMTGLAQIRGFHGYIGNFNDLYYRVYYDLEYISGWNIFTDIQIFIKTFQHVFKTVINPKPIYVIGRRYFKLSWLFRAF